MSRIGKTPVLIPEKVTVDFDGLTVTVKGPKGELKREMPEGVSQGFSKKLEIVGVGSRAQVKGKNLIVSAGYSHPVEMTPPDGITYKVESNTNVTVSGIDKEVVGNEAAKILSLIHI